MTIIEMLKRGFGHVTFGNQWVVYKDGTWVVHQRCVGPRITWTAVANSEEEAIEMLLAGIPPSERVELKHIHGVPIRNVHADAQRWLESEQDGSQDQSI